MHPKADPWTVPAAAEHLGVSARTVWRWIKAGKVRSLVTTRPAVVHVRVVLVPDGEVRRVKAERGGKQ